MFENDKKLSKEEMRELYETIWQELRPFAKNNLKYSCKKISFSFNECGCSSDKCEYETLEWSFYWFNPIYMKDINFQEIDFQGVKKNCIDWFKFHNLTNK